MTVIISALFFILGAALGSFLSVVIHRTHTKKKGILLSRSMCASCGEKLHWSHLVPVFSWLFLQGKCAYCGKKISSHYFVLELITGGLFVWTFLKWNFLQIIPSTVDPSLLNYEIDWKIFQTTLLYLVEFSLIILIAFYDFLYKIVPDRFSLPAIGLAILGGLVTGVVEPISMLIGGLGIGLFFAIQFFLSNGKWVGGGDMRLGVLTGVLLGWEKGLLALAIAYIVGAAVGTILLASKKASRKTQVPFGPFLVLGTVIAIFFGDQLINWYLTSILI